ncbi:hypothetical protein BYT27DRAFT_7255773 [Phlegmacium glaucopus]|nr:hypothetical protein BYT27DRAFT_7255773 [Phlegmacium glaucopus]
MPPKPSFCVNIPANAQGSAPLPPPTTMTFELPGWPLQNTLQPDAQHKSAFTIKKSCLSEWNLNVFDSGTMAGASSTSNLQGLPTPQTPKDTMDFEYSTMLDDGLVRAVVEKDGYLEPGSLLPLTPAKPCESALGSPFSLFRSPRRNPTPQEFNAAEAMLSLLNFLPRNDLPDDNHAMVVDSVVESWGNFNGYN